MALDRANAMGNSGVRLATEKEPLFVACRENKSHGILIVDDEEEIRDELCAFLSDEGFACVRADSGDQALDILRNDPRISILLTDINMPGMDGLELLSRVKKQDHGDLAFILLTGQKKLKAAIEALRLGAQEFLLKPIGLKQLLRVVRQCEQMIDARRAKRLYQENLEAERRWIRVAFSKYISPAMVEQIVENPGLLTLGGSTRDMTILFCDVRGFTSISERFDAEGLTDLVNKLLTPLSDIILAGEGTVDKYMGDCIMAFWNAPLDNPSHARDSCVTALKIVSAMGPLNERLKKDAEAEGRPHFELKVGLGLNSGEAAVGNLGSARCMNYSVLGDTVNTASRLEAQSKTYGVDIVIGPNTQARVEDLATMELDLIRVKGKTVVLKIYALIGDQTLARDPGFLAAKESLGLLLTAYRKKDWAKARDLIVATRQLGARFNLDVLCDLYHSRITAFEACPPPADWDRVFNATSK